MAEGSDGSRVDELLQLSTLQRLARQRITEMEVGPYPSLQAQCCLLSRHCECCHTR